MDFPIVDLLDDDVSAAWLLKHMRPHGLKCPHCRASVKARPFREATRSQLTVYRCLKRQGVYTLYSGAVFAGTPLRPAQVILLLRGVCQGEPTAPLARELGLCRMTVHALRHAIQANAVQRHPPTPVPDDWTETDEMFQHAGGKRGAGEYR